MKRENYIKVHLKDIAVLPPIDLVKTKFRAIHPGTGTGLMSDEDYRRLSYVYSSIKHFASVLDIGVGAGQFVNSLAVSGRFERVCGIDITKHSNYERFTDSYELKTQNVADMPFDDGEFDVVVCMEVLEHLESETLVKALSEIRRVCRKQLLVTVPFNERVLPKYHCMRFTDEDVAHLFPDAHCRLLLRNPERKLLRALRRPLPTPWLLIEENYSRTIPNACKARRE